MMLEVPQATKVAHRTVSMLHERIYGAKCLSGMGWYEMRGGYCCCLPRACVCSRQHVWVCVGDAAVAAMNLVMVMVVLIAECVLALVMTEVSAGVMIVVPLLAASSNHPSCPVSTGS